MMWQELAEQFCCQNYAPTLAASVCLDMCMIQSYCAQVVVERAAAVVGNLSTLEGNFQALREAGVMQRLVLLLEQGPQVRTPAGQQP